VSADGTNAGKTSGAGHYWTYQAWLPDHGDQFFKYNDETVTCVPKEEVLQDRTGSDANPALLCYVRKGEGLVDTLHREILELVEGAEEGREGQAKDEAMSGVDREIEALL
jgi:ubiquitin carboxyl-terminal hydrolase 25/28